MENIGISAKIEFIKAALAKTGRPLVMIGMMGSGKSKIGEALAQSFGFGFIDTDAEIVKTFGKITDIFANDGEAAFRSMELNAVKAALEQTQAVISVGGGAFFQKQTRKTIQEGGLSIWLNADLETIYNRVKDKTSRPLLEKGGDKRGNVERLLAERTPIHQTSHVHVSVTDDGAASKEESIAQNRDRVINALYKHLKPA